MTGAETWEEKINDYTDTIYAMVGFANFYRYDDDAKKMRDEVAIMQGWRFTPVKPPNDGEPPDDLTPDLAVMCTEEAGLVAEVKKSFPMDRSRWADDFKQLMSYDADLDGWPNAGGRVARHDVVLLVHLTRSRAVTDYYLAERDAERVAFSRPFAVVEFGWSGERQDYFFFRRFHGSLSDQQVDARLHDGVPVPMMALLGPYSMVKLYDGEPPLPYFLHIIWQEVLSPMAIAKVSPKRIRRKQKVEIEISLDDLTRELRDKFSFKVLFGDDHPRQPKIPCREWVKRACDKLVSADLAEWLELGNGRKLKVFFQRFEDVLATFKEVCGRPSGIKQKTLFDEGLEG
ncbi:hypothetical protein ACFL09_04345 [Planctomycetota bacterium]